MIGDALDPGQSNTLQVELNELGGWVSGAVFSVLMS